MSDLKRVPDYVRVDMKHNGLIWKYHLWWQSREVIGINQESAQAVIDLLAELDRREKALDELREAVKRIDEIAGEWLDAPLDGPETGTQAISDVICQVASEPLAGFIAGTWPPDSGQNAG